MTLHSDIDRLDTAVDPAVVTTITPSNRALTGVNGLSNGAANRLPLPTRAPLDADSPPPNQPLEPVAVALQKLPPLPLADQSGPIQIEPSKEEQQAFDQLFQALPPNFTRKEYELLLRAYKVASYAHRNQQRESGEPYMLHPIAVTKILIDMHMDASTLAAGLLHDVAEDSEFSIEYIQEQFGPVISMLVDGVTKLKRINELGNTRSAMSDSKAESLRKMFLAMVEDIRVVLIKLADRLHNMRTLSTQKDFKRRRIARETLEIFAPLANRLGIWKIKSELEDLSFRYLEPASYRDIAKAIQQKQDERDKWVIRIKAELERELAKAGIPAEVSARTKHIYSIWRKMKRKEVSFDQIYDVYGFRVIVENEAHCYFALGIVHSLWHPIPGEFDDYIANPKNNMYRSLHTAVLSKRSGRPMEVQIRTHEMHQVAEYGIAAHWQYKEQAKHDADFQRKVAWIRQLMEWRQEVTDADEFMDSMKTDVFKDRVFVFTPQGDVVDLPAGATPIDFAYAIHTELGNRCRGANVNGRLVPLDYKLKNGDQVVVIAAKRGGPSRDWLNPDLEYVATQRARSKIRTWLRKQGREENVQRGKQMLEKEMRRLSVNLTAEAIAKLFNHDKPEDFYAAVGYGDINSQQIAQAIFNHERREQERLAALNGTLIQARVARSSTAKLGDGLMVQGVEGLLTQLGRCCTPVPGDPIIGYVTKGRGVTIHRTDCPNVATCVRRGQNHRLIDVQWTTGGQETYPVKIQISAYDRAGLMRDVASLVADEHINMLSVEALTGQKDNLALINATLEIEDVAQLMRILTKIDRLPNIVDVRRTLS
ncbi:MAG: bifunctional (p)ppGpp synthetase/guanosine-3',5'-bis(diphosphate) 3'-pyrophosphohydrolase [Caldilinea sp. CFX5]|nr:bifunctional (p)ppGpp synthetase/guanosine-3',5'-bis(diphosphate) 3'-pyrophosphohydrolase [Caldilinea sp. CFX5]